MEKAALLDKWARYAKYIDIKDATFSNLVYFHAFTGSFKNKKFLFDKLSNCNIYAFDMPGHGESKIIDDNEINIHNFINLATEFIIDFDIKNIILFGHSMGGGICNIINGNSQINSRVKKIILEAPANPATQKNYDAIIKKLIPNSIEEMELITNELFYDPIQFFGSQKNYLRFVNFEFSKLNKLQVLKQIIEITNYKVINIEATDFILNNNKPSLLILGKQDEIIPHEETLEIFSKNKNFEILSVDKAKHLPILEGKDFVFEKIVSFIEN